MRANEDVSCVADGKASAIGRTVLDTSEAQVS
jgi:hypothetical protein